MPEIALGQKFSSFESLKDAIERYQRANNVQLIVKDSKLLGRIAKTMPKLMDIVNQEVMYYRLAYACQFHGEYRNRKGKERPNHKSKRRGCPMRILLRLAEDLHHLVVYELYEQHNHELTVRDDTKAPQRQMFRMARINDSRYTLTKLEEEENGELVSVKTTTGNQVFDEEEESQGQRTTPSKPIPSTSSTPVATLIGNATKRVLTADDFKSTDAYQALKRRKIMLQNRKLELEAKKLELETKKLDLEVKLLERKQEEGDQTLGGNAYYVSHVIDDKEGISTGSSTFSPSAAEVIKSLAGRGQSIQIITQ